jgi:hypothetical protein
MMLGSYYEPFYPTPGQPRVAPGVGAYHTPAMGAYHTPAMGAYYTPAMGAYYTPPAMGEMPALNLGALVVGMAINGAAGYFVGKRLGTPVGGAVASGLFGLPGLFVAALLAPEKSARPNPNARAFGRRWLF